MPEGFHVVTYGLAEPLFEVSEDVLGCGAQALYDSVEERRDVVWRNPVEFV